MVSKYYSVNEVAELTGYKRNKAYALIKKLNIELREKYEDMPESEKPLFLQGKILKSYFDKKMEVEL